LTISGLLLTTVKIQTQTSRDFTSMKTSTKIILVVAFVGSLGLAGLSRVVSAKQSQSFVAIARQHHSITKVAEASDGDGETNDDAQEQQESAKLQLLAKITAQQAQQAAEASVGGKAKNVKLENEDGNLVYTVEIAQQDVKVDAGNGKVLYAENANQQDEKNEGTRPKSSIQVPEASDGDRQTNDDAK
jgi:uncharacterized membrane protein YkoI